MVRELIAIQDPTPELNLELAEEVAKLLGYAKLKKTLAAGKLIGELARVLDGLDIQPFSRDSIERYKAEEPDAAELTDVPEFFKRHRKANTSASVIVHLAFNLRLCYRGAAQRNWTGDRDI